MLQNPAKSTKVINLTKNVRRTLKSLKNVLKKYRHVTTQSARLRASQYLRAVKPKAIKPVAAAKKTDL